jgi:hypothetical protein
VVTLQAQLEPEALPIGHVTAAVSYEIFDSSLAIGSPDRIALILIVPNIPANRRDLGAVVARYPTLTPLVILGARDIAVIA